MAITFGIPPDELYRRLSAQDLADLARYHNEAPWGPEIENARDARSLSWFAHAHGGSASVKDLMFGGIPEEPLSPELQAQFQEAQLMCFAATAGHGRRKE